MGSGAVLNDFHPASNDPVLLDLTRLIAHGWAGRQATGIDRICFAYLRHFRTRAHAVVQHRGLVRVLAGRDAAELIDLMANPTRGFRARIARKLSAALVEGSAPCPLDGMAYINVGHTDFDLAAHREWVRRKRVRPFYFIHDLIPVLHPEFSRPHAVRRHLGRVRSALETGAGIILGSEAVKQELECFAAAHHLTVPPLVVGHLAGENLPAATLSEPIVSAPYFLCVGTIEPRKNHRLLFDVWKRIANSMGDHTPRLVIVGQIGPMTGKLLAPLSDGPDLQMHVEHRPRCTDAELAALLQHTRALLMPSLAEGFGLPFVEALQAGVPVIASDLPVFREIGQGLAQLLDPQDRNAWEQAILAATLVGRDPAQDARRDRFVPPRWSRHFDMVERFIASPAQQAHPSSEKALYA